ncbi:MAG: SPOR domain-containing protein [Candidatus Solibacter usitatus]|nr:SPOR domain-containing protein [Candidatus Solibacter usitatus]
MPRNDDGEFELVLGNRQLLSGFFIVVVLFGVFFTMGYVVGRHSVPSPAAGASAAEKAPEVAAKPAGEAPPSSLAPGQVEVVTGDKRAGDAADDKKPPAPPPEKAAEKAPLTTKAAVAEKPEPKKPGEPARTEPNRPAASAKKRMPQPGELYIQVVADVAPTSATGVVEGLKKKGIEAFVVPGTKEGVVRVVVGPFKDRAATVNTQAEIRTMFKDAWVKKY